MVINEGMAMWNKALLTMPHLAKSKHWIHANEANGGLYYITQLLCVILFCDYP